MLVSRKATYTIVGCILLAIVLVIFATGNLACVSVEYDCSAGVLNIIFFTG
jgi:uncharacterized integral membrane protein